MILSKLKDKSMKHELEKRILERLAKAKAW